MRRLVAALVAISFGVTPLWLGATPLLALTKLSSSEHVEFSRAAKTPPPKAKKKIVPVHHRKLLRWYPGPWYQ